jgi:hypothetical protein
MFAAAGQARDIAALQEIVLLQGRQTHVAAAGWVSILL